MELPLIGTPLFLVLGEGVNFRSRLESADGETFTVAAPLETTGPLAFEPGREFQVFWVPPRTRMMMPCRLVGVSGSAPFRWTLQPLAEAQQSNRREYVRGGGGPMVSIELEDGEQTAEAALLDISEGGLRCWLDQPLPLKTGDRMSATVRLGAEQVEVSGLVHTVRDAPHGDPGLHVVLRFDVPEKVARMIRLYILAWEISERRLQPVAA